MIDAFLHAIGATMGLLAVVLMIAAIMWVLTRIE